MSAERIERAIRSSPADRPAIVSFLTAGFPERHGFAELLARVAAVSDVVEIGVPFSDPMADGVTIQRSSRSALEQGVSLRWILEMLSGCSGSIDAPLLLMSYLNPLLAYGSDTLVPDLERAGVSGLIVPDLPFEECDMLRDPLDARGLALVQLVTPLTPPERLVRLAEASRGFLYAVSGVGTTGGRREIPDEMVDYLDRVRDASPVPVCAGFGIAQASQVTRLTGHVDGVIVGSALIETLECGEDPVAMLESLSGEDR